MGIISMINRKQLRRRVEHEAMKSGFVMWLEREVLAIELNLSDEFCSFLIKGYEIRENTIIIEVQCTPKAGAFEGI